MLRIVKRLWPAKVRRAVRVGDTRYIFKDASELPPSKPDYVVLSPTPLGHRPVPRRGKQQ